MAGTTLKTTQIPGPDRTRMGELAFFAASGVLLTIVLVVALVDAYSGEWRGYQEAYGKIAAQYAGSSAQRKLAAEMKTGYEQYYLPRLHRIDRCTTCHLGIENPAMADAPQPFARHPGDYLKHHRPDEFGCTVCHQGQGLATNTADAHGRVEHWPSPMLDRTYLEASCGRCHQGTGPLRHAPVLSLGRQIFRQQGCTGCHRIRKHGGRIGPELTGVAQKDVNGDRKLDHKDWDWHFRHFKEPRAVSPDSVMPNFGLSDAEAQALTALVLSLSNEQIHLDYLVPPEPRPIPATPVERGKLLFEQFGCAGCHGKDGAGGRLNPNAQSGDVVPALTKVKQGYSVEELLPVLKKGKPTPKKNAAGPKPPLNMPGWQDKLSDSEMKDLIAYLFSLAPEEDDWDAWDDNEAE